MNRIRLVELGRDAAPVPIPVAVLNRDKYEKNTGVQNEEFYSQFNSHLP
jgi:hypothetical protein